MINALTNFKKGHFLIVMDDENRENEGDLIISAEKIDESQMTFMINNTTGIICIALTKTRLDDLGLDLMVQKNLDNYSTAFTITTDFKDTTTGGFI